MTFRIIFFLFLMAGSFSLDAQNTFQPKQINPESRGIVYDKESTFDITLHTTGFGLAFAANFGTIKTYYKTKYYHFQIGELRHPKEERQSFDFTNPLGNSGSSKSFFFGKRNSLYVLRGGVGVKRYLSEKAKHKGLAIGFSYEGGVTLGLLKPYYLELIYPGPDNSGEVRSEKYSPENEALFLDLNNSQSIYGASGFTKGLSEIRPIPGIHFKMGAHFDWGAFDEMVKAIEGGFMIDVFMREVPLMVETPDITNSENRPFFVNLYITLQLGKRK